MTGVIDFLFLKKKRLSSHIKELSKHINYTHNKIHSFDKMSKMILDLGNTKVVSNDDYY